VAVTATVQVPEVTFATNTAIEPQALPAGTAETLQVAGVVDAAVHVVELAGAGSSSVGDQVTYMRPFEIAFGIQPHGR
jgi:hypothetical protein